MGSNIHNTIDIQQSFMNNITQDVSQSCIATTTNTANDNVVVVNGVNIGGNFTGVAATTSTDATCIMTSTMDDEVSSIMSAIAQQTNQAETDIFSGLSFSKQTNTFNSNQTVTNNISQINTALCSANTTVSTSGNYVYVSNSTVGGDFVGVTSNANSSANCSMTNYMKNVTYNEAQASATQSNSVVGMFGTLLGAITTIVIVIVIAVVIMFSVGSIAYVGYAKPKPGSESSLPPDVLADLNALPPAGTEGPSVSVGNTSSLASLTGSGGSLSSLLGSSGTTSPTATAALAAL